MKGLKLVRQLPPNTQGRDFIIGDLHGCYRLLMQAMEEVVFDKEKDRLFSVGDLADRGPSSERCLELIYEPWFYPVMGNHDLMFIQYMNGLPTDGDFLDNGGTWVKYSEYTDKLLKQIANDMVEKMSLAIEVEGAFRVTHAYWPSVCVAARTNDDEDISFAMWDRNLHYRYVPFIQRLRARGMLIEEYGFTYVLTPYNPSNMICYVGHNTLANGMNVFVDDHYMLDSGACRSLGSRPSPGARLSMVNHDEVVEALIESSTEV